MHALRSDQNKHTIHQGRYVFHISTFLGNGPTPRGRVDKQKYIVQKIKLLLSTQEVDNTFLTSYFACETYGPRSIILVNGYTTPQLWDMLSLFKKHSHDTGPVPTIQLLASAHVTIPSLYTWQTNNPGPQGRIEFYEQFLNWPWMGHPTREMAEYFESVVTSAHRSNSVWSHRVFPPTNSFRSFVQDQGVPRRHAI